jgi:hypothetical protein
MKLVIGGTYVHYKNKRYKVTGIARHSETLEEMVIYEALYPNDLGKTWVRPLKMFTEEIEIPGYKGPRFRLAEAHG